MTNTDPVPAIAEAEATGEVAELYADIRAALGVPVVNLIWRHLATFPGALPWAWSALRPLYVDRAIAAEAAALRHVLAAPIADALGQAVLATGGLTPADLGKIDLVLRSYERSNAMNLVALAALQARLSGAVPEPGGQLAADSPPADPPPVGSQGEAVAGEMPALLALTAMGTDVRALVEDLNRIGGRGDILASMYRHLAHWPSFLDETRRLLEPIAAAGRLEPMIGSAAADARRRGARLVGAMCGPIEALEPAVDAQVRAALERFFSGPISKMTAIAALVRQATPAAPGR